ncbi:MAG: ammonia channel protein, partial [Candidatus Dadabacteria bacterium]|nr:ammonia channel protein [Candidatus Dadabacteria bacterium]
MIDKALKRIFLPFLTILLFIPGTAFAQEGLDTGDTAWMLTATVLVLMMTIPGLFLFYGGLVRAKNALSTIMHSFMIVALV